MSKSEKRREPIPAGGAEERERKRKAELRFETGDEIVVSIPDPESRGHPRRYKAKIVEVLDERSPDERGEAS